MASIDVPLKNGGFGRTTRHDLWWVYPLFVFLGLGAFLVYSTWAALQGNFYSWPWPAVQHPTYLSPMYSPLLWTTRPGWWPVFLPFTAALAILWAPGGFRVTCYYYRGAYYKAFWADPPSCAVGEPRKTYWGERTFPLILQNAHRFFLYLALIFIVILAHDAWESMWFPAAGGGRVFGIGVGTLVMYANVILLGGYTLGCHSLRHLIGGGRDILSGRKVQRKAYDCVSCLNRGHMRWAWFSLFWVAFTDLYIRLVAMGIWHDWRIH